VLQTRVNLSVTKKAKYDRQTDKQNRCWQQRGVATRAEKKKFIGWLLIIIMIVLADVMQHHVDKDNKILGNRQFVNVMVLHTLNSVIVS